jgi:hypothetical protein
VANGSRFGFRYLQATQENLHTPTQSEGVRFKPNLVPLNPAQVSYVVHAQRSTDRSLVERASVKELTDAGKIL